MPSTVKVRGPMPLAAENDLPLQKRSRTPAWGSLTNAIEMRDGFLMWKLKRKREGKFSGEPRSQAKVKTLSIQKVYMKNKEKESIEL